METKQDLPILEFEDADAWAVCDRATLDTLLDLAVKGCAELTQIQADALAR